MSCYEALDAIEELIAKNSKTILKQPVDVRVLFNRIFEIANKALLDNSEDKNYPS